MFSGTMLEDSEPDIQLSKNLWGVWQRKLLGCVNKVIGFGWRSEANSKILPSGYKVARIMGQSLGNDHQEWFLNFKIYNNILVAIKIWSYSLLIGIFNYNYNLFFAIFKLQKTNVLDNILDLSHYGHLVDVNAEWLQKHWAKWNNRSRK